MGLCALLLFFAVATKLAAYHPQEESARQMAHTKVWQDNAAVSLIPEQAEPSPSLFAFLAVLLMLLGVPFGFVAEDAPAAVQRTWFSPYLSVRPPPAR